MKNYPWVVRFPLTLALVSLILVGVFSKRGWLDWKRIVQQNEELVQKVEKAKKQKDELIRQVESLRSNPVAQERAIRQSLGYIRSDEVILEFSN